MALSEEYKRKVEFLLNNLTKRMVMSYIDYIIRNNMSDFKQVGFIGTPFKNTVDKR